MAKSMTMETHNASWSDLTHDVLSLIMMQLGVVDFLSFSRVCKSWRLLALSNKNKFLASRPPMSMWIGSRAFRKYCLYLEDFDGRKFKTTLPHSAGKTFVGLTCGYLILYGKKDRDFWLVNPITSHELHFPAFPLILDDSLESVIAILVYSPSMSGWVFVMGQRCSNKIWFSRAGNGAWNQLTSNHLTLALHAFKGEIYAITMLCMLCNMRLCQEPKRTLLKIKTMEAPDVRFFDCEIVSLGESLYVIGLNKLSEHTVLELDTSEMKWVQPKNTKAYEYLVSVLKHASFGVKQSDRRKDKFLKTLYYTHDCMSVDTIH